MGSRRRVRPPDRPQLETGYRGAVPRAPLVLVPPSEGKSAGGTRRRTHDTFADLLASPRDDVRRALQSELSSRDRDAWGRLLGAKGELLDRVLMANAAASCDEGPWLPAWRRFTGVVWTYLDPATLSPAERSRVLVPSGLLGLSRGSDPVPDFRLGMKASLSGLGTLSTYWRPHVTTALTAISKGRPVVDFLPNEHAAALGPEIVTSPMFVRVRFLSADGVSAAGHDAKAVKGVAIRVVLREGLDALRSLDFAGWRTREDDGGYAIVAPRESQRDVFLAQRGS